MRKLVALEFHPLQGHRVAGEDGRLFVLAFQVRQQERVARLALILGRRSKVLRLHNRLCTLRRSLLVRSSNRIIRLVQLKLGGLVYRSRADSSPDLSLVLVRIGSRSSG